MRSRELRFYEGKHELERSKITLDESWALADKQLELLDAKKEIADARATLADAWQEILDARATIEENRQKLLDGEIDYRRP